MHANHRNTLLQVVDRGLIQYPINRKFRDPTRFWMYISATRRGRDPTSV